MDFSAGKGQMSPEMLEAQRRLAKKQQSDRENQAAFSRVTRTTTARTPSGASVTHTRTTASYSAVRSTPVKNPARPRISPNRPASAHSANHAKTAAKMPRKEPSGPLGSENLETLEFDALDSFGSVIAPQGPTEAKIAAQKDAKKDAKADKKSKKDEKKAQSGAKSILSGKSPFINTLNLEKRPLSGHSVNKAKIAPKAPIAPAKAAPVNDNIPTMVSTKRKSKKSSIALAIAIFLTVILGAVVGTFVYLAFFQ